MNNSMTSQTSPSSLQSSLQSSTIAILTDPAKLPQPYPTVIAHAQLKSTPEDFQVNEIMDIDLTGKGEHLWLQIQKVGMNTTYLAEQLAKWAGIPKRDVGYSGLKDRQAVTTQWFSLRLPKQQLPDITFEDFVNQRINTSPTPTTPASATPTESASIINQQWHNKKLNRGTHRANHFVITLRDIELNAEFATSIADVDAVLAMIATEGVPNYFGEQRFGRQGNNISQALEWFEQGTINGRKPHPKKSRDLESILLSAARSVIFNHITAKRVVDKSWNTGMAGEVFNLNGSGSVFASEVIDDTLMERVRTGDIHPTAPLWGIHNDKVSGDAKALEEAVIDANPILQRLACGLESRKVKTMRRALRLPIGDISWVWQDDKTLVLDFNLPSGSFATGVIHSFVGSFSG